MDKTVRRKIIRLTVSFFVGLLISIILIYDNQISNTGGAILTLFQMALFYIFIQMFYLESDIIELKKSKSNTERIINSFAESELLSKKLESTLINDLNFDKNIKNNLKHIRDPHLYISKIKLETYFQEFFIYDTENNVLRDVPSAYFESKIWKRLVNDSDYYYSTQKFTDNQVSIYINNTTRQNEEINTLQSKITGINKTELRKLFIIDDDYFENDSTLKKGSSNDKYEKMYNYLKIWYDRFNDTEYQNKFPIKVAKSNDSVGHLDEDIGIFGNMLYGIQRLRNNDEKKIMKEDLKIDFYFDIDDTMEQKDNFIEFFNNSKPYDLKTVLNIS